MRPDVLETVDDAVWDEKYGMWIRPNTMDEFVCKEMPTYRHLYVPKRACVLDLGSNIGASAKYFLEERGAYRVICVEPEHDNWKMLRRNTAHLSENITYCNAAVTEDQSQREMTFYITKGANKGNHTTLPVRGREAITVPVVTIQGLLETWQPNVIKCDIEGGEHAISKTLSNLPGYVESLVIDYTLNLGKTTRDDARALDAAIVASGFDVTNGGRLDTQAWTALRTYRRNWTDIRTEVAA